VEPRPVNRTDGWLPNKSCQTVNINELEIFEFGLESIKIIIKNIPRINFMRSTTLMEQKQQQIGV